MGDVQVMLCRYELNEEVAGHVWTTDLMAGIVVSIAL